MLLGNRSPPPSVSADSLPRPAELRRSRADADLALRVLGSGRPPRRTARLSDVYMTLLPQELTDRFAPEDDLPVVHLRACDTQHNAFRHRLKRPAPVAGIGLHDPKAGIETMLQQRLRPSHS